VASFATRRSDVSPALRSGALGAALTLLLLALAAEVTPVLRPLRILSPPHRAESTPPTVEPPVPTVGEAVLEATETRRDLAQPEHLQAPPRAEGPIATLRVAPESSSSPSEGSPVAIVDDRNGLAPLFRALHRAARRDRGAVARILFFGDSMVASDFGTGTLRRLLQDRFGDAGHGFVLAASAWPQYFHNDISRNADRGFRVSRIVGPRVSDGLYGLGGVSFSASPGLRSRVGTAREGDHGRAVSRFEIEYLAQPGGGRVELSIDGSAPRSVDTAGADKGARVEVIEVPDGPHQLELLTAGGPVRLFGFVLERAGPGVVLDAVGIVGARLRTLDESDDAHFAEALAWRRPDLVVYQFGANESSDGFAYPMPEYHRTMLEVLGKVHRAIPGAGCLVVGAMDRARKEGGRLVTVPIIPILVEEQRKVAEEAGCAFYPTFEAMGGKGSMASWVRQGLGTGDYTHPTSWGAEKLGKWIYAALMDRYGAVVESPAPGK